MKIIYFYNILINQNASHPTQLRTGCGGYFVNRSSVFARSHMKKTEPRLFSVVRR